MKIFIFALLLHSVSSKPQSSVEDVLSCSTLEPDYKCVVEERCLLAECARNSSSQVPIDPRSGVPSAAPCDSLTSEVKIYARAQCYTPRKHFESLEFCCHKDHVKASDDDSIDSGSAVISTAPTVDTTGSSVPASCLLLDKTHLCVPESVCRVRDCLPGGVSERAAGDFDCKGGPPTEAEEALQFDCSVPKSAIDPPVVCCDKNFVEDETQQAKKPALSTLCGAHHLKGFVVRAGGFEPEKSETYFGEWPNMCAMFQNGKFLAAASLITPGIVLTAGHKLFNFTSKDVDDDLFVRCGDWNLSVSGDRSVEVFDHQEIKVKGRIVHPSFAKDVLYHNIAVVSLEREFNVTVGYIFPACIPKVKDVFASVESEECVGIGWGRAPSENEGSLSDVIRQARLPLVNQTECERTYKGHKLHHSLICAGGLLVVP